VRGHGNGQNNDGHRIGQPIRRREDLRLVTGGDRYSDDLTLPSHAYAMMVRSPYAHALIRSLETEAAAAMPGVLAVLTSEDVRQVGLNPMPHIVSVGGGAHSGRALRLGSIVMLNASNEIIEKGKKIAARLFEADVADIEFAGGEFAVTGTDRRIHIFEVASEVLQRNDLPDDLRGPLQGIGDETVTLAAFPYGSHVCEVEVDPETRIVDIVRYSAVDDVGRAVNPMIVHGQIHGGIVHGVSQALMEDDCYDYDTVQPIAGSFMDYAMPRADSVPHFDYDLSEVPGLTHPLGVRPAGEGGTTPALAVVINAVVDALAEFGVRHVEMPATPERVWRAIRAGQQGVLGSNPRNF
jgi:aerobic carbon-monoxide dehydrogenase large subunit